MQDLNQALAFVAAITGDPNSIIDVRGVHDTNNAVAGRKRRGTVSDLWAEICAWNNEGFGVFVSINETDGQGVENPNVTRARVQVVDLDNLDAQQQFANACHMQPQPTFYVATSPGKFHIYWKIAPHNDLTRFTTVQRKLVTKFNGDPTIIDPARIMRLPGTYHMKVPTAPTLVQCFALGGPETTTETLDLTMWAVMPSELGAGGLGRTPIGDGDKAPSTDVAIEMLNRLDVRQYTDRNEWAAVSGAFMQSVNSASQEEWNKAYFAWLQWNEPYPGNDVNANAKFWNDTTERGTTVKGWGRLHREATGMTPQQAKLLTGHTAYHPNTPSAPVSLSSAPQAEPAPDTSGFGPILDPTECAKWFHNCIAVTSETKVLCADNVFRDSAAMNMKFGGKAFVITVDGKTTDEPYKAATRSQLWTLPQVEFTCFRPDLPEREIITDELGRRYVNIYMPAKVARQEGDPTPFLRHLELVLPDESDRASFLAFLAHNVQYPGHKIFWAPLLQGAEGIGKNVFKKVMNNAIGKTYFYQPKAKQLNESGSKFNGWMENKVFFLVDEIKTDDKREMMETLKPFITETELEIEGKGSNQRMGDTPGNWLFFSNHKDALPITYNTRRHAIYYSALQTYEDVIERGMNDDYFNTLYHWLDHEGGAQIVTDYLMKYPVERGSMPVRAPKTSSTNEAVSESRGWLEDLIIQAATDHADGFKGGWASTSAIARIVRGDGRKTVPAAKTIAKALKDLGYHKIGQAGRGYFNDDPENADKRAQLWSLNRFEHLTNYAPAQGYQI